MDQLKAAMAWLAKYHFWVLSGLIVLVGLVVWFLATSDLNARYNTRKQKIDGDFQAMQGIQGEQQHPNERVIQATQAKQEDLKKKVMDAWRTLFKQQEEKNPWPDVLGQDFVNFIKSQPVDAEIPAHLRETYQNFIIQRFPKLLELIDVRRPKPGTKAAEKPSAAGEATGGESEAKPTDFTGMVFWDENNLKGIQEPYKWATQPSTLQVRMAQEDLWVYEALLRIIKNTNEGARDYYKAPVRRIEAVEIGPAAAGAFSRVGSVATFGAAEGGEAAEGGAPAGEPAPPPEGDPNAAPAPGAEGAAPLDNISRNLLDRRYVDSKGKPLIAGAPHPYPEFKMMPIRLKLVMNQVQIPKLLSQCANSNMPVEVRQVRIRPDDSGRFEVAGAATAASATGPAGGGAPPGPEGGAPGPAAPAAPPEGGQPRPAEGSRSSDDAGQSLYVPVEVLGIIYIYNPPDQAKLRPAAAAGDAAAPGAAAPADAGAAAPGGNPPVPGAPPAEPAAPPADAAPAPAAAPAAAAPAPPGSGPAAPAAAPGGATP
jgi:hypothetical protein